MEWIKAHGDFLFQYSGSGQMAELGSERCFQVEFDLVQLRDGRILCDTILDGTKMLETIEEFDLTGATEFGYRISVTRLTVKNQTMSIVLGTTILHSIVLGKVSVQAPDAELVVGDMTVRYHIVNFNYFNKFSSPIDLEWSTGSRTIRLAPYSDYRETIRTIAATKIPNVTAIISVDNVKGLVDLDEPTISATELCWLMSLAQGCHIGWIARESHHAGRLVERFHDQVPLTSPTGHQLIPAHNGTFARYIEHGLSVYRSREADWTITKLIDMYVRGAMTQSFPEPRGLQFAALMDVMRGIYARAHGKYRLIDEQAFTAVKGELKQGVGKVIKQLMPEVKSAERKKMLRHIGMFQWYPFADALKGMAGHLHLDIPDKEIDAFVASRDNVVHQYGASESEMQMYDDMMALCSRFLLGILGYQDYFYDWSIPAEENWENRKVKLVYKAA